MPTKKFFLCTWNCENQNPGDPNPNKAYSVADLASVKAWVTQEQPDVICFGMQEVLNGARFAQTLQTEFAANYTQVEAHGMKGMTKPGSFCYTFVITLVKTNDIGAVSSHGHSQARSFKHSKPTKGGAVAQMEYHGLKISFASTHLDAGSTTQRSSHVNGIENAMKHGLANPRLSWFMGDLNYRLRGLPWNYTVGEMVDMILSDTGRRKLYQLDTFDPADFPGYTFPDPEYGDGEIILPTYKRVYHPHGAQNPCNKMMHHYWTDGPGDNRTRVNCALCYALMIDYKKTGKIRKKKTQLTANELVTNLGKDTKKSSKRTGHIPGQLITTDSIGRHFVLDESQVVAVYDLGWLDRIGYKAGGGVNVRVGYYEDVTEVTLSDHAPVFMTADVSW